jgi:hypothetical protein
MPVPAPLPKALLSKPLRIAAAGALVLCGCQNPFARNSSLADRDEPPRRERREDVAGDGSTSLEAHRPEDVAERFARERQPSLGFDDGRGRPGDASGASPHDPPGVRVLLEDGHRALARGQVAEARALYEQVLTQQPQHAEAHHRLAILADRDGRYVAAEHHYHAALRGKPDDADLLSDLGYSYFLQGRPGESEHYLQEAIRRDPHHPHARENLNLLRDPARAATVLRELQGPQAESTLARLFPMGPSQMGPPQMGPAPMAPPSQYASARPPYPGEPETMPGRNRAATAGQPSDPSSDQPPPGVDPTEWLWQKMQAAGTESVAQQPRQSPPSQTRQPQWPTENDPPAPSGYPPRRPAAAGMPGPSGEFTAAQIRSAFEAIDRGTDPRTQPRNWPASNPPVRQAVAWETAPAAPSAADPYAAPYARHDAPPVVIEPRRLAADRTTGRPIQRAAAPQWDSVPRDWPDVPITASRPQPDRAGSEAAPTSASFEEAARRAAELGMQTGPGSMFPSFATPPAGLPAGLPSGPQPLPPAGNRYPGPTPRELPGMATQFPQATPAGASWPGEGGGIETRYDQNGPIRQIAAEQPTAGPAVHPLDEYEQMRREHAAEFNADLQNSAAQRGHWNGGPPARPPLPSSFDPRQRPWPEYGPDDQNLQFQSRQVDQSPTEPPADPSAYARRPAAGPAPQYGAAPDYTGGMAHDYGTGAVPSYNPGLDRGYDPGYGAAYQAAPARSRY